MASSFVTTSVQSSASLSVVATGASITYYARLWYTLPYAIRYQFFDCDGVLTCCIFRA